MVLKKRKRTAVGKMAMEKDYPKISFEQAIDLVVSDKSAEGVRPRTLKDYKNNWRYFVNWLVKNYEIETVDELSPQIFRDYINYLKHDAIRYEGHIYIKKIGGVGLADTTINIRLRIFKAMLNHLEREELIAFNAMDSVRLLKQDIDLTNCFTDEEIKELFRQPEKREYVGFRDLVAMTLLLDCGLRANELLSLRATDIDFQTRFITLKAEVNKNRKPRIVPMSAHSVKMLIQLIGENQKHFTTDRVFLSQWGEPLGQNHFNKRLKYYADKVGIKGKKVTAHVYRHTWAKNMTINGCDAFTLQKMGGWSDIRTMRRYIQMDTDDLRKTHDNYSPVMNLLNKKK